MSAHLPILQGMFPGKLMLNANDIARCLSVSKGHIYNLVSQKRLPFKITHGLGDQIMVSVVQMAQYLDRGLADAPLAVQPEKTTEGKRKVGRPRGTTKATLKAQLFQSEVRIAIFKAEVRQALFDIGDAVNAVAPDSQNEPISADSIAMNSLLLQSQVRRAHTHLKDIELNLGI